MTEFPEEPEPVLQPEKWAELGLSHHMTGILDKIKGFQSKRSQEVIEAQRLAYQKQIDERKNTILHEHYEQINECCSQVGYCCTRLQPFTPDTRVKSLKDYIFISQLTDEQKKTLNKQIFNQIVNLLKVLHYQRKYPKSLQDSFIVNPVNGDTQLFASQFSQKFDPQQLLKLGEFLNVNETVPQFFLAKQQLADAQAIEEVAKVVHDATQLTLDKVGTVFIKDGKALTNNEILQSTKWELNERFWTLMVRFGQQQEACYALQKLPPAFGDYLEKKKEVPGHVAAQFPGQDPVEVFRLVVGMHPTEKAKLALDKETQEAVEKLAPWYRSRIEQIAMVTRKFQAGEEKVVGVDLVVCPPGEMARLVDEMM